MCGRYVMAKATSDLVAAFAAEQAVGEDVAPSWNVAPTDHVRIVTERERRVRRRQGPGNAGTDNAESGNAVGANGGAADGGTDGGADDGAEAVRRLATARWGLVPVWAKDPKIGARMINARRETVLEKPAFRDRKSVV